MQDQRALKPHARLTEEEALDIYRLRAAAPSAVKIAACYGISEKAVRDIWTARTWSRETSQLDSTRTVEPKQIGRPKGRTDSKPRRKRASVNKILESILSTCAGPKQAQGNDACNCYQTIPNNTRTGQKIGASDVTSLFSSGKSAEYRAHLISWGASVDDQLFDWGEEFWTSKHCTDPFHNDWRLCIANFSNNAT
jgi:hypothetical protein